LGLVAILRLFLMDSEGLRTALEMARGVRADAVEILPAVAVPYVAHRLPFGELPPAISGGLVERPEQVEAILRTPVMAVSTSHQPLWTWRPRPEPPPAPDAGRGPGPRPSVTLRGERGAAGGLGWGPMSA